MRTSQRARQPDQVEEQRFPQAGLLAGGSWKFFGTQFVWVPAGNSPSTAEAVRMCTAWITS